MGFVNKVFSPKVPGYFLSDITFMILCEKQKMYYQFKVKDKLIIASAKLIHKRFRGIFEF